MKGLLYVNFLYYQISLLSITKVLFSRYGDTHRRIDTIDDEIISSVAVDNGYYAGNSYKATRVKKVKESCNEYYSLLALAGDKIILSQRDYNDMSICVDELRTNSITKNFFNIDPWDNNIEKVFQLKFRAEWNGIPVRCMFDKHLEILKIILNLDYNDSNLYLKRKYNKYLLSK